MRMTKYTSATKTWSHPKIEGIPPFPRMLHAASMIHSKMYVVGGVANNIPMEDMWVYDVGKSH